MSAAVDPSVNFRIIARSLIGKWIRVQLTWGQELRGRLEASDPYLNLQLELVEQYDSSSSVVLRRMCRCIIQRKNFVTFNELNEEEKETIVSNWQSRGQFYEFQPLN